MGVWVYLSQYAKFLKTFQTKVVDIMKIRRQIWAKSDIRLPEDFSARGNWNYNFDKVIKIIIMAKNSLAMSKRFSKLN